MKPSIEITYIPLRFQALFDWLLTGLGILEQQGMLQLEIREPFWQELLRSRVFGKHPWPRLMPVFYDRMSPTDYFCMTGRLRVKDRVMNFAVDVTDSPYNFGLGLLETVDLYFKCQCPTTFEAQGFPLNSQVRVPYHPDVFTFARKIRPAMLGRPLARSTSLKRNLRVLQQWESDLCSTKHTRIFASFGSDGAPVPFTSQSALPAPHEYEDESAQLARWGDAVHHPNLKRGRVVEILRSFGKTDVSACLFRSSNPDIVGPKLNESQYQSRLRQAAVNVNISGYRRSLPFRFMDTFLSGGMVVTDTLAVRWHAPFDMGVEVTEFGDLGYEPESRVDWAAVKDRLLGIYDAQEGQNSANVKAIRDAYNRKWAPLAFARHFLSQCMEAL